MAIFISGYLFLPIYNFAHVIFLMQILNGMDLSQSIYVFFQYKI